LVDRSGFETPRIFSEIQRLGDVDDDEMERVFNMGIGMLLVVSAGSVETTIEAVEEAGCVAGVAGRVVEGTGRALVGT
jgi:phosphoribosylformylglycinamidine cyclo-ligase